MIVNSQKVLNPAPTNFQLHLGDGYEIISDMESELVHMVLTDPHIFLMDLMMTGRKGMVVSEELEQWKDFLLA